MRWHSQLTQLIFDFYREDPHQLRQIKRLQDCKLSRRWGVFRIHCRDLATAQALATAGKILCEPIALLRLAKEVRILVNGVTITTLPIESPKLMM